MDLCYMYLPIFHVRKFMAKLQPVNRHPPFLLQCMHAAAMHYALSCGDLPRLELTADRAEKAYFTALTMVP